MIVVIEEVDISYEVFSVDKGISGFVIIEEVDIGYDDTSGDV